MPKINLNAVTSLNIGMPSLKRTIIIPIKNINDENARVAKIHLYIFSFILVIYKIRRPWQVARLPRFKVNE